MIRNNYPLWHSLSLFFSGWGVVALLTAWAGVFYVSIFIAYTLLCVALFLPKIFTKKPSNKKPNTLLPTTKHSLLFILFVFLSSLLLCSFLSPTTFFSGRDEGSIFEASAMLAQNHSLISSSPEARSFFEIYEQNSPSRFGFAGQAINFPGFSYTSNGDLITQFPTAPIAWFGSFIAIFGYSFGVIIANTILLFLFFLAFSRIIETFASRKWATAGIFLIASSFPIFWFSRFTLTENFFLAFLWIYILTLHQFLQTPSRPKLILLTLATILLLFARVEGVALVAVGMGIALWHPRSRAFLFSKPGQHLVLPIGTIAVLSILSLFIATPFYITVLKGFLRGSLEATQASSTFFDSLVDRAGIFSLYGLSATVLTGLLGILILLRQKFTPKILTTSLLVIAPSLLYLFVSFISPDHPWMLRRFAFSIIPLFTLFAIFTCFTLFSLKRKILGSLLLTLLFVSHIPAIVHFFPLTQSSLPLANLQDIASLLPSDELILVDQLASGDQFLMIPGPLRTMFGKHAVYFMNPNDIENLDTSAFSSISLLVPRGREGIYDPLLLEYDAQLTHTIPTQAILLERLSVEKRHFPQLEIIKQDLLLYRWQSR